MNFILNSIIKTITFSTGEGFFARNNFSWLLIIERLCSHCFKIKEAKHTHKTFKKNTEFQSYWTGWLHFLIIFNEHLSHYLSLFPRSIYLLSPFISGYHSTFFNTYGHTYTYVYLCAYSIKILICICNSNSNY